MSQTDRLAVIARLLENGQTVTTRSLMARFEVKRATIMRDIAFLRDRLGMPITYHHETHGFKINKSDRFAKDVVAIPGLWLTQDEAYALLTLFNITRQLDAGIFSSFVAPLHRPIKRVLGDAGYTMLGFDRKVRVEISANSGLSRDQTSILKRALLNDEPIHLKGKGLDGVAMSGTYIPQAVVLTPQGWVVEVLAPDAKANELKKMSLQEIETIKLDGPESDGADERTESDVVEETDVSASDDSTSLDKRKALEALARERRSTNWTEISDQFRDVSTYHDGAYDCDHVSPYTKGADNVNSEIFVMLQDWSPHEFLENLTPESKVGAEVKLIGRKDSLPTNKKLVALLNKHFSRSLAQVYATNLFPFIKQGDLSADIPQRFLVRAAEEFALKQVRIVNPKFVICFGLATFNAVRACFGLRKCETVKAAIDSSFTKEGVQFWAQAHPGSRGQNIRNKLDKSQVENDWKRMKREFDAAV